MLLYARADLEKLAHEKHGGPEGVLKAAEKRALRASRAAATRASTKASRHRVLKEALETWGLSMRSDSWLCGNYLKHGDTPEWSLEAVVQRMCQMRYLHEHTNYRQQLRGIRDAYRIEGHRWDARETEDDAEQAVIRARGWPRRWPWLGGGWTTSNHKTFPNEKRVAARTLLLALSRKLGVDNATCASIGLIIVAAFMEG